MKNTYIVSDVHGDYEALRKALYQAGLFDNHGLKDPGSYVVQIGDLANCVEGSVEDDLRCLDMVGREIDLLLIGNHEMPYFDPSNYFSGFHFDKGVSAKLAELRDDALLAPAFLGGKDTLVAHAGLHPRQMFPHITSPQEVFDWITKAWDEEDYSYRLFSDCGRARYGAAEVGGILWCDFDREFSPTEFPQIVGHTPGMLRQKGNALCIDTQMTTGYPTVLRLEV